MATASPLPGEFLQRLTLDRLPGWDVVVLQAYNQSLTTVPVDLRPQNTLYTFPTSPGVVEALSSSANDTALGTGARTVLVSGLDANYNSISDVVTLNGITPVALPQPYFRVNSVVVQTVGTGETNAGNITVRTTVGGNILSTIPIIGAGNVGSGVSMTGVWTVPANKRIYFLQIAAYSVSSGPSSVEIQLRVRERGANKPFITRGMVGINSQGSSFSPYKAEISRVINPGSDIRITVVNEIGPSAPTYALMIFYMGPNL